MATESLTTPSMASTEAADVPANTESVTRASHRPIVVKTSPAQILLALWLAASTTMLIRLIARFSLGLRLARWSEPVAAEHITEAIQAAKLKLQVATPVILRSSKRVHSPVIWCWGKQPVLLVADNQHGIDHIDWESIVCHELAHWKRRDHLASLFAELMVCALPWQPLLWLARHRLIDLSEEACDDWVITSGQVATRYARTLLGLTPQEHIALVPAVVSSRKGLATRVRRILTDCCVSPRSGRCWLAGMVATATCLVLSVAFAQAGSPPLSGSMQTALGHGGVIQRLASTATIRGRVLGPDGNPISDPDRVVGIAVLPATTHSVRANVEGQFDIPWSPSWIDPGQPVYLVARDGAHNLARIVTTNDPANAPTIHLAPALTVSGRVLDPNGQPIVAGTAMLSLPIEFKCRAPIAGADIELSGTFAIETVPRGQSYTLMVRAKGYQSQSVTVAAADENADTIELGSITLQPRDPAHSVAADAGPNPNWEKTFDETHRLNEGEIVRLIKVPFSLERQDRLIDMVSYDGGGDDMLDFSYIYHQYGWDRHLEDGCWYAQPSNGHVCLGLVINTFLEITSCDFDLPGSLARKHLAKGDWILRKNATTQQKLQALEEIIRAEWQRPIRFEKRTVERDTIVVAGQYAFTPLPGSDSNQLCIFAKENAGSTGEAESLAQLWQELADRMGIAIEDRTEPVASAKIEYRYDSNLQSVPYRRPIDTEKDLPALLDNLARQTDLTFTIEKRPREVWFAVEDDRI